MAEFWKIIEENTTIRVPKHLQNILKALGYDDATSIKSITAKDIDLFEENVRNEKILEFIEANDDPKDFYHTFNNMKDKFRIPNDDRVKLNSVVEFVKNKMASEAGRHSFSQSEQTVVTSSIKSFYSQDPKSVATLSTPCHLSSSTVAQRTSESVIIDLTSPEPEPLTIRTNSKRHDSKEKKILIIVETTSDRADKLIIDENERNDQPNVAIAKYHERKPTFCKGCGKITVFHSALGKFGNLPNTHWKKVLMVRSMMINDTVTIGTRVFVVDEVRLGRIA